MIWFTRDRRAKEIMGSNNRSFCGKMNITSDKVTWIKIADYLPDDMTVFT